MTSFMAVTLHWIARTINGELELKTALGGFRYVRDKHSGDNIAARFIDILTELNILNKIGGITMDNASNNNAAMVRFEELLEQQGIKFSPEHQRIRCFSHVIHLAAQDSLTEILRPADFDPAELEDPLLEELWNRALNDTLYTAALESDLVARIQELVRKFQSSGQRHKAFRSTIITRNREKRFQAPVPELNFLQRVSTHWSSAFHISKISDAIIVLCSLE
jgi:hypothetical protein